MSEKTSRDSIGTAFLPNRTSIVVKRVLSLHYRNNNNSNNNSNNIKNSNNNSSIRSNRSRSDVITISSCGKEASIEKYNQPKTDKKK